MKICNHCGQQVDDQSNFCTSCGSNSFAVSETAAQPVVQQEAIQSGFNQQPAGQAQPVTYAQPADSAEKGNGNIIAGVVGAFLFSLIGGLLYFAIYQCGYIAGIVGLVIFVLANFGYNLFSKNKGSIAGLVVSIIVTVVMIFLAEYFCLSFEIYQTFKTEADITFFDAVRATPDFLSEPEVSKAFLGDLAIAYIFSFIASIGSIINIVKARKKA